MKLHNQSQQTFKHDYTDPKTGVITQYVSNGGKYVDVPDDLAEKWLRMFPAQFQTDKEAQAKAVVNRLELEERDKKIADLTVRLLAAEKIADELSKEKLEGALGVGPSGEATTAAPSAVVSEAVASTKRAPGRPAKTHA